MIIRADSMRIPLRDESVQLVVTSPPYWGLRKYAGVPDLVWGGDGACAHEWGDDVTPIATSNSTHVGVKLQKADGYASAFRSGTAYINQPQARGGGAFCRRCNAWRGQLGLEPTIALYIEHMVAVFREVKRVLRPDGCVFLNIGDSYMSGKGSCFNPGGGENSIEGHANLKAARAYNTKRLNVSEVYAQGLKPKDLCLIPERLAIALQDDGWYVRSRIAWIKPAPMPESVTDRPTSAWEHIFLLTKSANYYWDAEAVREKVGEPIRYAKTFRHGKYVNNSTFDNSGSMGPGEGKYQESLREDVGRNIRNWWLIGPDPFSDAHFATFPRQLVQRCILAGTPERGSCSACGTPWVRQTERVPGEPESYHSSSFLKGKTAVNGAGRNGRGERGVTQSLGWCSQCTCNAPTRPALVFDCFLGSGTVGQVAELLGRRWVGTELSEEYCRMAQRRASQKGLFTWTDSRAEW